MYLYMCHYTCVRILWIPEEARFRAPSAEASMGLGRACDTSLILISQAHTGLLILASSYALVSHAHTNLILISQAHTGMLTYSDVF